MNAYIYQAALFCEQCISHLSMPDFPESEYDSDEFPKGPYADGGGEADCPQHCDECHTFLENPLTTDGREYVLKALGEGIGDAEVLAEWARFYDL